MPGIAALGKHFFFLFLKNRRTEAGIVKIESSLTPRRNRHSAGHFLGNLQPIGRWHNAAKDQRSQLRVRNTTARNSLPARKHPRPIAARSL